MRAPHPTHPLRQSWRGMSLLFLSLLPILTLFHLVMWFGFTRTLFRPETGDLKRIGYLVGFEDHKFALAAQGPKSGYTMLMREKLANAPDVHAIVFGDSFAPSLARAYSIETKEPVGLADVNWEQGNGLAQIESWLTDGWFQKHGVRTIIVERVEYAWLDTFADKGNAARDITWTRELTGTTTPVYQRAPTWTFANNGNFKVVLANLAYLVSPTAFKMTDTCVVPLTQKFFNGSYGDKLLFYRGDLRGGLKPNDSRLDPALKHAQELSDLCRQQGLQLRLIVPPVKSYLYYDWVRKPFYPDSKLLETLQQRAAPSGYVDVKQRFHRELAAGYLDFYYPDDAHWNFPAAQIAAQELTRAGNGP